MTVAELESPFVAWPGSGGGLATCLTRLAEGIAAGRALGLPIDDAEEVRREADARLNFPSDTAVVALVGGTGVGKSTLLNTLAGRTVSEASPRRPTTGRPVAWIPKAAGAEIGGLLSWLGVDDRLEHDQPSLGNVAVLDLPDLDSIATHHREQVEELLPRVDAVIWLTDPEKYGDAVLHDDFLRRWIPRLDRQIVVLNKVDRLQPGDTERVRDHLSRSLGQEIDPRRRPPHVVTASALHGEIDSIRLWLANQVETKRVVAGRLAASARAALEELARQAGVDPSHPPPPLVPDGERRRALEQAKQEILRLVDLPAVERQAVAATRAAARPSGAGPLGRVAAWIYRTSGRQARVADPAAFLATWAERGSLAGALDTLRSVVDRRVAEAPLVVRPSLAAAADAPGLAGRLRRAVDTAITANAPLEPPRSWLWPVIGLFQTVATAAVVLSAVWLAIVLILRPPVDSIALPVLGQVPAPYVALVVSLAAGLILARALSIHAGWRGRRWAGKLRSEIRKGVDEAVSEEAFETLDRLEAARRSMWVAVRGAEESCGSVWR